MKIEIESTDTRFLTKLIDFLHSDEHKVEKGSTVVRFDCQKTDRLLEAANNVLKNAICTGTAFPKNYEESHNYPIDNVGIIWYNDYYELKQAIEEFE